MCVDNRDYGMTVRGDFKTSFIFYDLNPTSEFKVNLHSKANNGQAFRQLVSMLGIRKLPYSCRVYTDECGSMAHVEIAAALMGVGHAYIPPDEHSLNEAETIYTLYGAMPHP